MNAPELPSNQTATCKLFPIYRCRSVLEFPLRMLLFKLFSLLQSLFQFLPHTLCSKTPILHHVQVTEKAGSLNHGTGLFLYVECPHKCSFAFQLLSGWFLFFFKFHLGSLTQSSTIPPSLSQELLSFLLSFYLASCLGPYTELEERKFIYFCILGAL